MQFAMQYFFPYTKTTIMAVDRDIKVALSAIFERREHSSYLNCQIKYCNADESCYFTKSFIASPKYDIHNRQQAVSFSRLTNAFEVIKLDDIDGVRIIDRKCDTIVTKQQQIKAFHCLQDFWKDRECHEQALAAVRDRRNRSDLSESAERLVLAVHLFSRLVPGGLADITVAKTKSRQPTHCPCGCPAPIIIGDTGIGNSRVWHGFPDMLVQRTAVSVAHLASETDDKNDEDGDEDCIGVSDNIDYHSLSPKRRKIENSNKHLKPVVKNVNEIEFCRQIMSQCLSNGYAQKSKLNFSNNLVASIGCTLNQMLIYLYDPDEDVLLRSLYPLDVLDQDGHLVLTAVIELWLILNLHIFGATMTETVSRQLHKCCFKSFLERYDVLEKYQQLKAGVGRQDLLSKVNVEDFRTAVMAGAVTFLKDC